MESGRHFENPEVVNEKPHEQEIFKPLYMKKVLTVFVLVMLSLFAKVQANMKDRFIEEM